MPEDTEPKSTADGGDVEMKVEDTPVPAPVPAPTTTPSVDAGAETEAQVGSSTAAPEENENDKDSKAASPTKEKAPKAGPGRRKGKDAAKTEALQAANQMILDDKKAGMKDRFDYLVSQSEIFAHFMGRKPELKDRTGKRRRMTEKEEDDLLLKEEQGVEDATVTKAVTRLDKQPPNITAVMRPYQLEGLNFLISLYERSINGILADEMGLGKTLQTISMFAFLRLFRNIHGPHLVIAPKSTLGNWENECAKWCPEIKTLKFMGDQEQRNRLIHEEMVAGKFDVLITSYEMVVKEKNAFSKFTWRYLVIDEAHRIKNEKSILSQVVRVFNCQNRLLITGTPLQNNLRELWALLNFLLPDIFSSAEVFDDWFASVEKEDDGKGNSEAGSKNEIVSQLHAVLKPFLIRRLKSDVATDLPPKQESVILTPLTPLQATLYKNLIKKDIDAINGQGGDRVRLLNILMQLRKCVNHPYLFDGVEDRSLDPFGEHLIQNCGKLRILDKLLPKLKADGHRILIFSQMTRVLDILEDYCSASMRDYAYCRIDGNTDGDSRDAQIEEFNRPGSEKFIFLLSTRAGGLGINLASADTVILYDSDWNPQVDLQAMDRAHRIGQKRVVKVFRLITEKSVEERIYRKALEKLRLDSIVIQQGRLAESKKNLGKDEVLEMIRYGAETLFNTTNVDDIKDEDIDLILARGKSKTEEINAEIAKLGAGQFNMASFKMDNVYDIDDGEATTAAPTSAFILDVGKRERRVLYDEANVPAAPRPAKSKNRIKLPKEPVFADFQFFNTDRLRELYEQEREVIEDYNQKADEAAREGKSPPEAPNPDDILTEEEQIERAALLDEGFSNWNKREFLAFCRACERHGRKNLEAIWQDMGETKTFEEVKAYSESFWKKGPSHLENWAKIKKSIEEGEVKIVRRQEMEKALALKCERYEDPWRELEIAYAGNRGKAFTEEEDRWLVCMTWRLGYGRWEELKLEARRAWQFRFDWFFKSRSPAELRRRVEVLIRVVEKENEEIAEQEKEAEKRRKAAKKGAEKRKLLADAKKAEPTVNVPSGAATPGPSPSPTKKRKLDITL